MRVLLYRGLWLVLPSFVQQNHGKILPEYGGVFGFVQVTVNDDWSTWTSGKKLMVLLHLLVLHAGA